jgi:hypothetical protein
VGQQITVTEFPGSTDAVRQYVLNRSITGMKTERYPNRDAAPGDRPPDVIARRLFDLGASTVTVYSNIVTVEMAPDAWAEASPQVLEALEYLFRYYGDDAGWSWDARGLPEIPSPVQ